MSDTFDMIGFAGRERIASQSGRGLELFVSSDAGEELVRHLEQAKFGSAGIRYRRLDLRSQLSRLVSPLYIELRKDGKLVGTYALSIVPLEAGGDAALGVYRALLTVEDEFKRRGLAYWMVGNTLDWVKDASRVAGRPVFSWGCIESNNERSIRLLRSLGAQPVGRLESKLVYRQWPRSRGDIAVVSQEEFRELPTLRRRSISDCGIAPRDPGPGQFFCMRRNGEPVVAARADLTRLRMETMGSRWDSLYRYLLRHAAAARRRFDPDDFRYVRIADPVIGDDAAAWRDFISGLLAHFDAYMAMIVLDPASRLHAGLADARVFGQFGRATRQSIEVFGQAWHCDPTLLQRIGRQPLGIGPLDL